MPLMLVGLSPGIWHVARGLITRTAVRRLVVISQLRWVPVLWHVLPEQPN